MGAQLKMRATKSQLRRIIKEEKTRLTKEAIAQGDEQLLDEVEASLRKALDEFITIYDEYLGYDTPMHTIRRRIDDVVGDAIDLVQNYKEN